MGWMTMARRGSALFTLYAQCTGKCGGRLKFTVWGAGGLCRPQGIHCAGRARRDDSWARGFGFPVGASHLAMALSEVRPGDFAGL